MSGFNPFKAIGKVFKKVVKVVKKVWEAVKPIVKPLLIAAAVYFTAGAAIGAFGGASFVSALPGFGAGGIFTSMATAVGVPGFGAAPLFGSSMIGAAGVETVGSAVAAGSMSPALTSTALNPAAAMSNAPIAAQGASTVAAGNAAAQSVGLVGKIAGGIGTAIQKYPAAAMMVGQGVSGAMKAKTEQETAEAERERQDSFGIWGAGKNGSNSFAPRTPEENQALAADPSRQGFVSQVAQAPTIQAQQAPVVQSQAQRYMTPKELQAALRQSQVRNPVA